MTTFYPAYTEMPRLMRVGCQLCTMNGGMMRFRAIDGNAPCAVEHQGNRVLGWACRLREDNGDAACMIYVMPRFRRRGIGTRLIDVLFTNEKLWDSTVWVWDGTKRSKAFYIHAIDNNPKREVPDDDNRRKTIGG